MTDLVAFLHARMAEDEQAAYDADRSIGRGHLEWSYQDDGDLGGKVVASGVDLVPDVTTGPGQHIARHDPARVLAEVDSKRRIMAEHNLTPAAAPPPNGPTFGCETCHDHPEYGIGPLGECDTLKHLALAYAWHKDYQKEWRP
ncbi:DUF6221 family protein [Actinomadura sp. GTD37]|uniref:DUF6221 family protein n=1 Tax=Actinomadura sp. GTD37 TaxID=1778030 RepID=UPI0035BF2BA0